MFDKQRLFCLVRQKHLSSEVILSVAAHLFEVITSLECMTYIVDGNV